ncbi:hypothetical protein MTR_8g062333 [Medicago truncatula]|uniref:Uncharacterized protein n=1 Tax=Medicago truncatula TaxID=3880 RepID=A0A072TR08_MEDTR|nr:hypothetical protein MTR_8g062333 [Medicago truncatula]
MVKGDNRIKKNRKVPDNYILRTETTSNKLNQQQDKVISDRLGPSSKQARNLTLLRHVGRIKVIKKCDPNRDLPGEPTL